MGETISLVAGQAAIFIESAGALIVAFASLEALVRAILTVFGQNTLDAKKAIWVRFAMWLVLGLELELAADIVRSSISPTWSGIGQLAAIAAIRTFLNYHFLERDIERMSGLGLKA